MENTKKTRTRGNVIVEDIKIGDIHYENDYGQEIKVEVISLPVRDEEGLWEWQSKCGDEIIDYAIHENYTHYGPKLNTSSVYLKS